MQQQGAGGSQYGTAHPQQQQQQRVNLGSDPSAQVAEEASPISSRPPAVGNFEDLMRVASAGGGGGGGGDEYGFGGEGGAGGSSGGGNRWPRQETLALLRIRSEMDPAFRDATLKGPLWEDVSRKLAELGYKRSAKKCKEKFENVHKYYKRTKESRAGRQDGKSYKFFSELEALDNAASTSLANPPSVPPPTMNVTAGALPGMPSSSPVPVSVAVTNPVPVSSVRMPVPIPATLPQQQPHAQVPPPHIASGSFSMPTSAAHLGISFSSDSSEFSSSGSEDADEEGDEMETDVDPASSRKRKRESSKQGGGSSQRKMEFFEGLMNQVMQKQEAMQQRFLEAIEKREQDRMIREEAWKRQEMARLTREQELMAQERAASASRDAAIIAFLQKITGQTIQLPTVVATVSPAPPPPTPSVSIPPPTTSNPPPPPPASSQQYQKSPQQTESNYQLQQQQPPPPLHPHYPQPQSGEATKHQSVTSTDIVAVFPEQQIYPKEVSVGGSSETSSSRWPKAEVIALIKLRSGLESKYQEAGPKGPLWEEISAGMQRMGYNRNPKRCKEKWENINKYFKKVKESNKKRPEDAKTCPYFHELDALYQKKIIGNTSGGGSSSSFATNPSIQQQQQQHEQLMMTDPKSQDISVPTTMPSVQLTMTSESEKKNEETTELPTGQVGNLPSTLFGEGIQGGSGGTNQPEDIVREQHQQNHQNFGVNHYHDDDEGDGDEEEDDETDDEVEEQMKMAYKIQFQREDTGSSNGGGNGAPSFLAVVR